LPQSDDNFVLRVTVPTWKPEVPVYELQGADPSGAFLAKRKAYWPESKEWVNTPTYQWERLQAGNPLHTDGLVAFFAALRSQGFSESEINQMSKINPAKLLGLKAQ